MRSDYSSVGRYSRTSHSSSLSLASAPSSRSSKLVNTNLDDLPDDVLIEILSRLPCYEFVFQCKSVCKLWGKLMTSELYFIGRFVLQQQRKRTETPRPLLPSLTLMNQREETPVTLLPTSSPKLVDRRNIKSFVLGVCNDLVFCCERNHYARDYAVCNPYTAQRATLNRPHGTVSYIPVGFICDPIYKKTRHDVHGEVISIDFKYRCKVVRVRPCEGTKRDELSSKLRVEICSFDTDKWRESIVSLPRRFTFNRIDTGSYFVHNGVIYWSSTWGSSNFLIGLDPFMISDTNNNITTSTSTSYSYSSDDHECHYTCRFIELAVKDHADNPFPLYHADHQYKIRCLGVAEGRDCLQICVLNSTNNTHYVLVWDLKQELITNADGVGKLCSKEYFSLDIPKQVEFLSFDPTNEDLLYARLKHGVDGVCFSQINFRNRRSEFEVDMAGKSILSNHWSFRICAEPFWPTPVPRLPIIKEQSIADQLAEILSIRRRWEIDEKLKSEAAHEAAHNEDSTRLRSSSNDACRAQALGKDVEQNERTEDFKGG